MNAKITVTIKGDDSIDAEISEIVPKIKETDTKTKIAQETHMHVEDATTGSIIIHLSPLTDTAIERFLRHDGRVVQDMLKDLLLKARIQDISKLNKEPEIFVKIRKKEQSQEEKGTCMNQFLILNLVLHLHLECDRWNDSDTSYNVHERNLSLKYLRCCKHHILKKGYCYSFILMQSIFLNIILSCKIVDSDWLRDI